MEVWKDIIGYEGLYQVNNLGKIKTLSGFVRHNLYGKMKVNEKIHKEYYTSRGYVRVNLRKNNKLKTHHVHRLVALSFIPNPNNKYQINHINGIKIDNKVENLEWCTNEENRIHAISNNLIKKGELLPQSKLKNNDIMKIFEFRNQGKTQREIAMLFNIGQQTVSRILLRKNWVHVNI
ncbi:MAG TPA: NUMOD4 domain-containing protein [Candidatus Babeliales bacterium]|nr:NUMOD4 domain-containing protein [Candidatus Babeliales bacterium]